jgi:hypothetical protein
MLYLQKGNFIEAFIKPRRFREQQGNDSPNGLITAAVICDLARQVS